MQIQMIGHASIFVETYDCKILIDPVFGDSFCEGLNSVCPKREVIHELLPEFDFLIISHRHLDHFDIRTLAYLNKKVNVLIPPDKLIKNCLKKLGFSKIICLKDFQEVKNGSTTILTTRSENRLPEFGIVVSDESGVFWNVVDTILSYQTISFIRSRYSSISFLLANWQPMLEINYQLNESLLFPYSRYNQMLYDISLIQPKVIAPGANGFKYIQGSSWLNRVVFPVTIERFCEDVKIVCPEMKSTFILNPGDSLMFCNDQYHYTNDMCRFVKKIVDDRDSLDFLPVMINGNLIDQNTEKYELSLLKEVIYEEICLNLPDFIIKHWNSFFVEHRRWQVIYQLEIFFPNGSKKWVIDFSKENIEVTKGRNPLANFFTYITASSFYDLIKENRDWDYIFCVRIQV
ncbi:MBL fold metallo-hydrolase [Nostoc sp.]|uniref:MBL fold metallo-hydrolase n=1 Tax=Nostoc sp. TaxID=1180 RepID=UPI002FF9F9AB